MSVSLIALPVVAQQPKIECGDQVAIAGTIKDEDGAPLPDAVVSVEGKAVAAVTQPDGRFELRCLGGTGPLKVRVARDKYDALGFVLDAPTIATVNVSLTMLLSPVRADTAVPVAPAAPATLTSRRAGASVVTGVVRDQGRNPLPGVRVELLGVPYVAVSDPNGRFRIQDVPFGPYLIRIRKVGYAAQMFTLQLQSRDPAELEVTLAKAAGLDTVRVVAKDDRFDRLRTFYERKERGIGGQFIEEAEIRSRRPFNMSDLLRGRPSVLVSRDAEGNAQVYGRNIHITGGYCPMALFLDGVPLNRLDGYIDRYVPIDAVKAIEIYPNAVAVPMEFQRSASGCGAVVVWTR
jgi:hypothetical protein